MNTPTKLKSNSRHHKTLALRTAENMTPAMLDRRHKFVEYLIQGHNRTSAAILAGCPPRSAPKAGSELFHEPYVQQRLCEVREALDEAALLTRNEQLLDLKGIAFNIRSGPQGRVQAHALLAKILGREAPTKVEAKVQGGVMFVPMPQSEADWEAQAKEMQAKLQSEAED